MSNESLDIDDMPLADYYTLKRGGVLIRKSDMAIYYHNKNRVFLARFDVVQLWLNVALTLAFIAYFFYRDPLMTIAILILLRFVPMAVGTLHKHD